MLNGSILSDSLFPIRATKQIQSLFLFSIPNYSTFRIEKKYQTNESIRTKLKLLNFFFFSIIQNCINKKNLEIPVNGVVRYDSMAHIPIKVTVETKKAQVFLQPFKISFSRES